MRTNLMSPVFACDLAGHGWRDDARDCPWCGLETQLDELCERDLQLLGCKSRASKAEEALAAKDARIKELDDECEQLSDRHNQMRDEHTAMKKQLTALQSRFSAAIKAYETILAEPWDSAVKSGAYTVANHLLPEVEQQEHSNDRLA